MYENPLVEYKRGRQPVTFGHVYDFTKPLLTRKQLARNAADQCQAKDEGEWAGSPCMLRAIRQR